MIENVIIDIYFYPGIVTLLREDCPAFVGCMVEDIVQLGAYAVAVAHYWLLTKLSYDISFDIPFCRYLNWYITFQRYWFCVSYTNLLNINSNLLCSLYYPLLLCQSFGWFSGILFYLQWKNK